MVMCGDNAGKLNFQSMRNRWLRRSQSDRLRQRQFDLSDGPKMTTITELFPTPGQWSWRFRDVLRDVDLPLQATVSASADRFICELAAPAECHVDALLDRFELGPNGLMPRRIRMDDQPHIRELPPLLITMDDQDNCIDELLPGFRFSYDEGPYDGLVKSKRFREVTPPGAADPLRAWRVTIVSRGARYGNTVVELRLYLAERLGLVRYEGKYIGRWFKLERSITPIGPPGNSLQPAALLGLTRSHSLQFANREDPQKRAALAIVEQGEGRFAYQGDLSLTPLGLLRTGRGVELTAVGLWGQTLDLQPTLLIAQETIVPGMFPPAELSLIEPNVNGPSGEPLASLFLTASWSVESSSAPWAAVPGGDYGDLEVRYLHLQAEARTVAGTRLPTEHQVLALHEPVGPVRVVNRRGESTPIFWDLCEAP